MPFQSLGHTDIEIETPYHLIVVSPSECCGMKSKDRRQCTRILEENRIESYSDSWDLLYTVHRNDVKFMGQVFSTLTFTVLMLRSFSSGTLNSVNSFSNRLLHGDYLLGSPLSKF
jgi:hypothetical protein